MDVSKLYLFDVIDATPRFYVVGKTVYRLNGEAREPQRRQGST
jgi:hypothetical protein